jgi:hypothetical protein
VAKRSRKPAVAFEKPGFASTSASELNADADVVWRGAYQPLVKVQTPQKNHPSGAKAPLILCDLRHD